MTTDTLPHNPDAERALIARLLVDPKQIPVIYGKVDPSDLYIQDYRDGLDAILKLYSNGSSPDIVSINDHVGRELDLPIDFLTAAHQGDLNDYIEIIKRESEARRVIAVAERLRSLAYRKNTNLLAEVQDEVRSLASGGHAGSLYSPAATVEGYVGTLTARRAGMVTGLRYGFTKLDETLQPAGSGDMIVVAARPSVGKTALAEFVADNWSTQTNLPILFASLEMTKDQIMDRIVSRRTGIPAQRIIRGLLNEGEWDRIKRTLEELKSRNVWFEDDPWSTTTSLRGVAARLALEHNGIGAIVVDYIQIIKDPGDQEVQRVTKISRNLKAMAREYKCPILVLSQLNRAVEMREDKHPKLSDLRESGAIEQDADVVLGLSRQLGTSNLDVEVLKNRQGPLELMHLWFDPDVVSFGDPPAKPAPTTVRYNPETGKLDTYGKAWGSEIPRLLGDNPEGINWATDSMDEVDRKKRAYAARQADDDLPF